jgi:hypothetical protein
MHPDPYPHLLCDSCCRSPAAWYSANCRPLTKQPQQKESASIGAPAVRAKRDRSVKNAFRGADRNILATAGSAFPDGRARIDRVERGQIEGSFACAFRNIACTLGGTYADDSARWLDWHHAHAPKAMPIAKGPNLLKVRS